MRVGFDVSALHRPHPPGVVRAVRGLVEALEERAKLDVVRLAPAAGVSLRRWRRRLPREVVAKGLLGLHSFTSAFPWRGPGRRVQTVHELPWRHGVSENAGTRHRAWAALGPVLADRVVVPTEHVARDLARRRLPGRDRIRVVPWGVGPPFESPAPDALSDSREVARLGLAGAPYVLCVGAVRAKKNLPAVLRGAAELRAGGGPGVRVAVTGERTPDLARDLELARELGVDATPVGQVDDERLAALLRGAAAVPVLSRSEGFGLPVLEALACGAPVLVPERGAQTEVAGDPGFRVAPDDPRSVAAGILRALDAGAAGREDRARRAAEFGWHDAAARVETLWMELA
jgi:glycosyltransferase involved in cell wall biosynthesis